MLAGGPQAPKDNKLKKAVVTGVLPTEYVVLKFVLGDGSEVTKAFAEGKLVAKEIEGSHRLAHASESSEG